MERNLDERVFRDANDPDMHVSISTDRGVIRFRQQGQFVRLTTRNDFCLSEEDVDRFIRAIWWANSEIKSKHRIGKQLTEHPAVLPSEAAAKVGGPEPKKVEYEYFILEFARDTPPSESVLNGLGRDGYRLVERNQFTRRDAIWIECVQYIFMREKP